MFKGSRFFTQDNRKSSRVKRKGKISSPVPFEFDFSNQNTPQASSDLSYFLKHPIIPNDFECSKKKVKINFDISLNIRINFWRLMNKTVFHSIKVLSLVHGRIVDLDLLEFPNCPIKSLFDFQGWGNIFFSTPRCVYEPLVYLFYPNPECETFVMGN